MPVVKLETLKEIKESPVLDSYGFEKGKAEIKEARVRKNESLYLILSGLDVSPQTISEIEREAKGKYPITKIRTGQKYFTYSDNTSNLANRLVLLQDPLEYVVFDWSEGVSVETGKKSVTSRIAETSGIITSSLYEALNDEGVSTLLGSKLNDIFAWQIDFFRIYKNDSFKVIYEQNYVDGEPYGIGKVLAAEFIHSGNIYDAFYYETKDCSGYFDSEGKSVQKALLKAPFKYSQRISSGFSHNRFHPVLHTNTPHYGVDYAAPLNTPVLAVGDGVVEVSRYKGASGNMVKIKHNGAYSTAYLHLNGFAKGIKEGARVRQGQVIGYVGRTGRVTGVHLDYRVYINGKPVNPLKISLPPSKGISEEQMEAYKNFISKYEYQLYNISGVELASKED